MTGKLPPAGTMDEAVLTVLRRTQHIEQHVIPDLQEYVRQVESWARAMAIDEQVNLFDPGDTGELTPPAGGEGKGSGGAPTPPRA